MNLEKNFKYRLDKLFVYGSLNNEYHFQLLTGVNPDTCEATLNNYKRITNDGSYPFALPWPGSQINGRLVFGITPEILQKLDQYEAEGQLFRRIEVNIRLDDRQVDAYVYIGIPEALQPYLRAGIGVDDRIEENIFRQIENFLDKMPDRFAHQQTSELRPKVMRELLSSEIHELVREFFSNSGLPPYILKHELEQAQIPDLHWLKSDSKAQKYADRYLRLATKFMILNQLEERFRHDYKSQVKVADNYYMHTISALMALKCLVDHQPEVEANLNQLYSDQYPRDLDYSDFAVAAIFFADELYKPGEADQVVSWIRANRRFGALPLGAEAEFSNLGVRAIKCEEDEDPDYDSFYYFYKFDLMRRGWKLGAHVDDHGFLASLDIKTRGFLELAFGRYKLLGDISKPATQDAWVLSTLIDLAVKFVDVQPHSLHLSMQMPVDLAFQKLPDPAYFLCLLVLGGDLRCDEDGILREMRIFRGEILHPDVGVCFSRLNHHILELHGIQQTVPVVEYQFPRLYYDYDYQPLIMAIKGFQLAANPYPIKDCKGCPFEDYNKEIETALIQWAGYPTAISGSSIDNFLKIVQAGLESEAKQINSSSYHQYIKNIMEKIEKLLLNRNQRIIDYHERVKRKDHKYFDSE